MNDLLDLAGLVPGLPLMLRMALVAAFVILVALLAERLGPFLGAMVASLPLSTGPIYLMLALEHDVDYLAAAALGSLAVCGATPVFILFYCLLARSHGLAVSLAGALGTWFLCALIVQASHWSLIEALLFNGPVYAVSVALARGFTRGIAVRSAARGRFDLLLRAVLCGGLAGIVVKLSEVLPPQATGILSVLPVLMTSLALVLHPRIGGPATAALFAHTLGGLVGMVAGFVLVHLTIRELGPAISLAAGLAVTVLWNLSIVVARRLLTPPVRVLPPPTMPPRRRAASQAHP